MLVEKLFLTIVHLPDIEFTCSCRYLWCQALPSWVCRRQLQNADRSSL